MIAFLRDNWRIVLERTCEHLALVVIAMAIALVIGVPLGVLAARRPALQKPIVGGANVFQTIPSLALFGFLLPFLNIGAKNAIVALVIYSILPLVRNTLTGVQSVDKNVREAAVAMGMTERQILRQVELPLAAPFILAGVRTATVLCIGIATIASFIAAGGLGVLIYDGLRNLDNATTLAGAIPAALLALGADGALGALQHRLENRSRGAASASASARVLAKLALVPLTLFLLLALVGAAVGARSLFGNRVEVAAAGETQQTLRIGSKEFTESRLLAEILAGAIQKEGGAAQVEEGLGGNLPHQALLSGNLDAYPEYTGTAWTEILKQKTQTNARAVYDGVKREYSRQFKLGGQRAAGLFQRLRDSGARRRRAAFETAYDFRFETLRAALDSGLRPRFHFASRRLSRLREILRFAVRDGAALDGSGAHQSRAGVEKRRCNRRQRNRRTDSQTRFVPTARRQKLFSAISNGVRGARGGDEKRGDATRAIETRGQHHAGRDSDDELRN